MRSRHGFAKEQCWETSPEWDVSAGVLCACVHHAPESDDQDETRHRNRTEGPVGESVEEDYNARGEGW